MVLEGPYGGSIDRGYVHYMTDGRTAVLETSELASTLVIYTDNGFDKRDEPHRYAIQLTPGQVTVIE